MLMNHNRFEDTLSQVLAVSIDEEIKKEQPNSFPSSSSPSLSPAAGFPPASPSQNTAAAPNPAPLQPAFSNQNR